MLEHILDIFAIIAALLPVIVKLVAFIAQKTHNQRLMNLSNRSLIIVRALEQQNVTNDIKKDKALNKLAAYANEVGIPVTGDQLDDYIESAVALMKALSENKEEV